MRCRGALPRAIISAVAVDVVVVGRATLTFLERSAKPASASDSIGTCWLALPSSCRSRSDSRPSPLSIVVRSRLSARRTSVRPRKIARSIIIRLRTIRRAGHETRSPTSIIRSSCCRLGSDNMRRQSCVSAYGWSSRLSTHSERAPRGQCQVSGEALQKDSAPVALQQLRQQVKVSYDLDSAGGFYKGSRQTHLEMLSQV